MLNTKSDAELVSAESYAGATGSDNVEAILSQRLLSATGLNASARVKRAAVASACAFVESDGNAELAFSHVCSVMQSLGRQAAAHDHSVTSVVRAFDAVAGVCLAHHETLVAQWQSGSPLNELRNEVRTFLGMLREAVLTGHQSVTALREVDPDRRGRHVIQALLAHRPVADEVLRLAMVDTREHVPVAWVDLKPTLSQIRSLTRLCSHDRSIALLRPGAVDDIETKQGQRIVIGVARPTAQAAEALALTLRVVDAVRSGSLPVEGGVVKCVDVASVLAVASDDLLTELLIDRYLSAFSNLSVERRIGLGGLLLSWLETRESIAKIAERHHVARQTAHDRLCSAKRLVGQAIDDPDARAPIIIALTGALIRWKGEWINV